MQFKHIQVADHHFLPEMISGSTVNQWDLARFRAVALQEQFPDLVFAGPVENRGRHMFAIRFRGHEEKLN